MQPPAHKENLYIKIHLANLARYALPEQVEMVRKYLSEGDEAIYFMAEEELPAIAEAMKADPAGLAEKVERLLKDGTEVISNIHFAATSMEVQGHQMDHLARISGQDDGRARGFRMCADTLRFVGNEFTKSLRAAAVKALPDCKSPLAKGPDIQFLKLG